MPIKKARLSLLEQARHRIGIQELRDAGVDCELSDELQTNTSPDLDILVAPPAGNILCELSSGITAYAILVKLIAVRSNIRVEDCRIVSPWDCESIALWVNERGQYCVGEGVSFPEDLVLNHRIENGLHFHDRGDVAEGWLVASGYRPIPGEYRDWQITTLSLTFTDQFGHDHVAQAEAILQRSGILKDSNLRVRNSRGVFEVGHPETEDGYRETASGALKGRTQGHGEAEDQRRRQHDDGKSVPQPSLPSVPAE